MRHGHQILPLLRETAGRIGKKLRPPAPPDSASQTYYKTKTNGHAFRACQYWFKERTGSNTGTCCCCATSNLSAASPGVSAARPSSASSCCTDANYSGNSGRASNSSQAGHTGSPGRSTASNNKAGNAAQPGGANDKTRPRCATQADSSGHTSRKHG